MMIYILYTWSIFDMFVLDNVNYTCNKLLVCLLNISHNFTNKGVIRTVIDGSDVL